MDAPRFEHLQLAVDGPLARLTLHRPERLNALAPQTLQELIDASAWLDTQDAVRVVLLRGAGRALCAGFDLEAFASGMAADHDTADLGRRAVDALAGLRATTLAAVHGACIGGGVLLVAACDLRLAHENAVFAIPEVELGIPLGWGGVPRLVRELGPALAAELILMCERFGAAQARDWRFVNRVLPAAAFDAEVERWAATLASRAPLLLRQTKARIAEAADALCSARGSERDADLLLAALRDPDARRAAADYLARHTRAKAGQA